MARLEIPSIVVHKGSGSRSESRPESPTASSGGMPALPSSRHALLAGGTVGAYSDATENSEMIEAANVNVGSTIPATPNNPPHRNTVPAVVIPSCPPDKSSSETDTKNFRNRANTKVKLLVRSHAMRESTSPPREPHNNNGGSPVSPHSPQSVDGGEKKFVNSGSGGLSPNLAVATSPKINNNESIYNSNLGNGQSPKQTRNTATSPTCRTPSRNGQSSPCQALSPKNVNCSTTNSTTNNKNDNSGVHHRGKLTTGSTTTGNITSQSTNGSQLVIPKCNNCVKNNQNERPGLLQTPPSPTKLGQALQHSPKSTNLAQNSQNCQQNRLSESRRPNTLNVCNNQCSAQCGNTLSVSRPGSRHKLRHQNSSQGSLDSGASPCLSRDSSTELYTDSTGTDLEQFIAVTINRNQKDRTVLLRIEKDLIDFAKDRQKVCHKFPNMSSYNRMLVHRVAAYFGMEHNVDQSGLSVIVTRTKNMRIPDTRFKEHIRDDLILTEEPRRSILKRDSSSFEDSFNFKSPDRLSGEYCRRSKSFEEREEEYERARRRIFKDSSGESSEVTSWPYWSSSESSDNSTRYRLLHPSDHSIRPTRLAKGESFDGRESYRTGVLRPSVSKSFSFGGYTRSMLSRGDSVTSTHSAGARLTKQDSGASMCSRLSPSSSGYKSQSQRSDATISPSPSPSPIPTLPCALHAQSSQNSGGSPEPRGGQTVMWAVTSISSVPPGSIIMNPRTNQPYTNSDGTIYRFDPDNPPKICAELHEDIVESIAEVDAEMEIVTSPQTVNQDHQKRVENGHHHQDQSRSNSKSESKRQRCQTKNSNNVGVNVANVVGIPAQSRVTNSATSPTLPFTSSPPIQQQQQPQPQQQQQQQQPQQINQQPQGQQQLQHQQQTMQECGQSLLKTVPTSQTTAPSSCPHVQTAPSTYVGYGYPGTETTYGQPIVYGSTAGVQQGGGLLVTRHPGDVTGTQQHHQQQNNAPPDMVFGQNHLYGNYSVAMQQSVMPQSNDVSDLSGYFMGMNVYEQPRNSGDSQTTPTHHAYSQPPPSVAAMPTGAHQAPPNATNQSLQSVPGIQTNYWQPPPNHQIPPQQAMYFVPPSGAALAVGQGPNDRQQQIQQQQQQQQRFASSYSFNAQTMTSPSQSTQNYVNSYPMPYNSVPTVAATPGTEYAYQPPVHMIPTYYPPGQPGIQPPPVMWRVPTPPNTPTSNPVGLQMPAGVPLMYVNSSTYTAPPAMVSAGTFGHHHHHHHQVAGAGTGASPAPPGAYMTPALVPNIVFRQNVPVVATGIRASTPAGSQRASRSPTPGHEIFGAAGGVSNGNGGCASSSGDNRNAQVQQRYPLPMYQGLHIMQGDMRLMHPGVPGNPRLQYASVPSPPVVQGCPRPFRPPSYSSNTSGCPTPNSFDGRNQKIRKQRSKVTTLPPTGPRSNVYQVPSIPSLSSNASKDIREGTVKVTITRRNQLVQY